MMAADRLRDTQTFLPADVVSAAVVMVTGSAVVVAVETIKTIIAF